ncbi:ATP-dependent DNA ligase [Paenibacillus filicis]|uniref:ATP-dependent DNA ligase n=1 Tax=Paenibacillus filicis TaxID=669464 RepID=A0ABU9DMG5_9BACL
MSSKLNCPAPPGTILDGELIVTDQEGKPDFEALQRRFQSKRDKTPVSLCAFDILQYKGIDVTDLPLWKRKELLEESFEETEHYKKVRPFSGNATDYFELIAKHGLEGIVIKYINSKYEVDKRSWSWQKVIKWTSAEVYISGYRKSDFGLLTSIDCVDSSQRHCGIVELGVTSKHKAA